MLEKAFLLKILNNIPRFFQHIYTLFIVVIGWVFFRSETFTYAYEYIKSMFGLNGNVVWNTDASFYFSQYGIILLLAILFSMPIVNYLKEKIVVYTNSDKLLFVGRTILVPVVFTIIFFLTIINLVSSTFNPFIYFRF